MPLCKVGYGFTGSSSEYLGERQKGFLIKKVYSPGNDFAYIVASHTSQRPHFVQLRRNGKVACDDQCPMWRGSQFCSHTVAAAEKAYALEEFWIGLKRLL